MTKSMLKVLCLLVAVTMLFGAALVGCGSAEKAADSTTQAVTEETKQEESTTQEKKEPVTITYTTFRYEDEAIYQTLIEKFQKENPEITVKFDTNKDQSAYYSTLRANIQSGENVDVMDVHAGPEMVTWAREGIIADLSDLEFVKNYADGPKALTSVDGKVVGYSQAVNMILCIYNKEIFTKHGVDVPKDWNDFVAIVKKLKDAGEGGVAYCGGDVRAGWLGNAIMTQVLGTDGYKAMKEGMDKGDIVTIKDNAQVVTALKTLSEYNKQKILFDAFDGIKYPQSLSLFAQKKAPIVIMGTWTFGTKEADYPGIDQGIFAIPTMDKSGVAYAEPAQTACVAASSKGLEASKKFVDFLASPENIAIYMGKAKMTPTIKGVKSDFPGADMLSAQMEQGMNVLPVFDIPKNELWHASWDVLMENILIKGADVDKEIDAFEAALKKADVKNKK
jgi:raffinose/stachyose/melibiose transport system substrate-binding protein